MLPASKDFPPNKHKICMMQQIFYPLNMYLHQNLEHFPFIQFVPNIPRASKPPQFLNVNFHVCFLQGSETQISISLLIHENWGGQWIQSLSKLLFISTNSFHNAYEHTIQHGYIKNLGVCSGTVCSGTALQAGRLRVWFLIGSTQPLTEMSTRNISREEGRHPVHRADNLTTFMCQMSRNSGSLNLLQS